ncbi:hypothetical protein SAMN05428975_1342 [Mucilaginibacter sp. OK268]|uniref:hypothetical protein n=1 Tax=Mucilaginibacter sp. OK268 TaxID=1881048 RepID=UPI0008883C60|nr:hypothetical protein [Mucilaginibacter sp. OK268]SDP46933.1 hypothetical protein SAMN05428975_1342 [Mucilaginibacter sp. OK268]
MWRKIHSNRDPRDTLYSELQKEFKPWFTKARRCFSAALSDYPRFFFSGMVILLLVSMVLSFTVFRNPEKTAAVPEKKQPNVVEDGFSRIMQAAGQLKETLKLKNTIDSLAARKNLSRADSLMLDSALSRLQHIHQPSK